MPLVNTKEGRKNKWERPEREKLWVMFRWKILLCQGQLPHKAISAVFERRGNSAVIPSMVMNGSKPSHPAPGGTGAHRHPPCSASAWKFRDAFGKSGIGHALPGILCPQRRSRPNGVWQVLTPSPRCLGELGNEAEVTWGKTTTGNPDCMGEINFLWKQG